MITLRNYLNSDINTLVDLANNKSVSRYLIDTFPYPYTKNDAEYWINEGSKENKTITKVILYNNVFVGSVGITPQTGWKNHIAEIGYWLGEKYWRKGITTEALKLMTNDAFKIYEYKKLYAPVLKPNIGSMKTLAKCGYEIEGVLKNEVIKDSKFYDIHQYAKYSF